jgi:fibronectin-binding autotransporter adhesin
MGNRADWDYPPAGAQIEDGIVRQILEGTRGVNSPPIVFGQTLQVVGASTLAALTAASATIAGALVVGGTSNLGGATSVGGTLAVAGATTLAALTAAATTLASLAVTNNATVGGTLGVTGATALTGALAANGGTTTTSLTATGNVALGDANTDTITIIGVSTFKNAAGTTVQLYVDAANNRVIVGSATALGSDTTPALHVVGRLYVAPESANDLALQVRRSSAATVGWNIGVASTNDLIFKDDSGTEVVRMGDVASAAQLKVTGVTTLAGATEVTTGGLTVTAGGVTLAGSGTIDGNGGTAGSLRIGTVLVNAASAVGSEKLRVSGTSSLEGAVAVTTGGIQVTGNSQITGSLDITGDVTIGNASTDQIRFYNGNLAARQSVTGSRGGGAALVNLLQALDNFGLITDATIA